MAVACEHAADVVMLKEEEEECFNLPTMSFLSATLAVQSSSLPPALRNAVQEWSQANGSCKLDVIVRVQEHCFPLHRDPITSQSTYLKQQLSECSDIAVDLPASLTADVFVGTIASCYGADVALSPANLAAAWAAADWLELHVEDRLVRRTEDYFFQVVATDYGRTAHNIALDFFLAPLILSVIDTSKH